MFSEKSLRNIALGTAIGVASFGAAAKAVAHNLSLNNSAKPEAQKAERVSLNTSTNITKNKGALNGTFAPEYDGPIKWEAAYDSVGLGVAFGCISAVMGAGSVAKANGSGKQMLIAAASSGLIVGGLIMAPYADYKVIQFDTKVTELAVFNPPHQEMRRHGKISTLDGPFFGQVLSIPETDLLLSTNNLGSPFLPGQKIKASFIVDGDNQIVSWIAEPGAR